MMPSTNKQQQGIVLIISLIMLVLLTLIGTTAMQVTGLEERMSGNIKNANLAFQAAETALRDGEAWIATRAAEPTPDSVTVWPLNDMDPTINNSQPWWFERNTAWWDANAIALANTKNTKNAKTLADDTAAQYIIEFKYFASDTLNIGTNNPPPGINYYRVTAKGTGENGQSRQLVQSTTARRF